MINATRHTAQNGVVWYTFPLLEQFSDRLMHAFSTRIGGVSSGGHTSLNLGISRGDSEENVQENFRRFGEAVGFDWTRTVLSQQTHTTNIRLATTEDAGMGPCRPRTYHDIDGLITAEKNLPLMTQYADCTPLLLYAADRNICATSHAGWRGTAAGMAEVTVERLRNLGCDPRHIYAVIGPSAGPCCYEVGEDTADHFRSFSDEKGPVLQEEPERPGKILLDMWRTNRIFLRRAGLPDKNIQISGLCTICRCNEFYSHRIQGDNRGALSALVMLK